jgi:hypothetical protein
MPLGIEEKTMPSRYDYEKEMMQSPPDIWMAIAAILVLGVPGGIIGAVFWAIGAVFGWIWVIIGAIIAIWLIVPR